nr:serine/threonine-protein kinase [Kribbella shirazensis]
MLDPIGVGGAGTVWRAWDRRQERLCAAKVLRQRDAGALLRFVREQGRRLDHPNVLTPYGWAADDDMALLAMDLVGGGSVANLVADFGPLPPRLVAELLSQLLGALDQIHTAGVLHRDVKPANLLLEATGTARPILRLTDFGIAIALGEPRLTVHGTVVGTPGYLAPEAFKGAAPSPKQDLYAAGVTAWQLLTGAEPPERGDLPAPPDTTAPIWSLVADLTQTDPAARPKSARAALAALAPTLAEPLEVPARTPDGEVIEVFDHLPPLPDDSPYAPPRPTLTLDDAAPRGPEDGVRTDEQQGDAAGRDPRGRRRTAVVVAVLALVPVVGGGIAALLADLGPFGDPPPSKTSTSPNGTVGPTTTGPTTSASNSATPVTRSADPAIRVGQPCGWQLAGAVETAADGTRVECRQQGASYVWTKVS